MELHQKPQTSRKSQGEDAGEEGELKGELKGEKEKPSMEIKESECTLHIISKEEDEPGIMKLCYSITPLDVQPIREIEEGEIINEEEEENLDDHMEDDEQNSSISYEEGPNATSTQSPRRHYSPHLEEGLKTNSELRHLMGFQDLVRSIPLNTSFEEAWENYPLELYFVDTKETKEDIEDDFRKVRISIYPHSLPLFRDLWRRTHISKENLEKFNKAVRALPPGTSFMNAWINHHVNRFFDDSKESMEDIREHFIRAKGLTATRVLHKVDSHGRFLIDLFIRGIEFKDALCDSGSCINLMSMDIAKKIGIKELQPSKIRIGLADSSSTTPKGVVSDLYVRIGNCNIPTDFHIVELHEKGFSSLILGGSFLATVGAVMDWPNQGMFFANVDKAVFYKIVPFTPNTRREDEDKKPPDDFMENKVQCYSRGRPQRACPQADSPPSFA